MFGRPGRAPPTTLSRSTLNPAVQPLQLRPLILLRHKCGSPHLSEEAIIGVHPGCFFQKGEQCRLCSKLLTGHEVSCHHLHLEAMVSGCQASVPDYIRGPWTHR